LLAKELECLNESLFSDSCINDPPFDEDLLLDDSFFELPDILLFFELLELELEPELDLAELIAKINCYILYIL
jgi:hypothetical protein